MWVREIVGGGYFGVGVEGTPPPEIFLTKSVIFDLYNKNLTIYD